MAVPPLDQGSNHVPAAGVIEEPVEREPLSKQDWLRLVFANPVPKVRVRGISAPPTLATPDISAVAVSAVVDPEDSVLLTYVKGVPHVKGKPISIEDAAAILETLDSTG